MIRYVFRCKQFVWMGNILKIACKWFLNGKNISKFDEELIKNYYEDSGKGHILEVDVEYPKDLHDYLHNDLLFLPERMKINQYDRLVCNLYDKKAMLFIEDL